MTDKARDRAGKRRKNLTPVWVALCSLLVVIAVVAGFVYAGDLIKEVDTESRAEKQKTEASDETETDIPAYDSELIYCVSPDAGVIDALILCRLDSRKGKLRFDLIDPGMSYNMSGSLYSELSSFNIRLPQTGRFGGLLSYCSGDGAFDAGRKIAEEMLAVEIDHFSSFDSRTLDKYISVTGKDGEKTLSLKISPAEAKGSDYGTAGTMMGFVKDLFSEAISSDRSIDDRLVYLEALDAIGDGDVSTGTVPVTVHNESMELDASGWRKSESGKK